MIKIKKDDVKIKVPKKEENEEAYLVAELAKGAIETAEYLDKDIFDVLSRVMAGIIMVKRGIKEDVNVSVSMKMEACDG